MRDERRECERESISMSMVPASPVNEFTGWYRKRVENTFGEWFRHPCRPVLPVVFRGLLPTSRREKRVQNTFDAPLYSGRFPLIVGC